MAESATPQIRLRHESVLRHDRHDPVGPQNLRLGSFLLQEERQERGDVRHEAYHCVFSRKPPKRPAPGVEFVSEPVKAFARSLRATPGKHIWMMGGGELIASF